MRLGLSGDRHYMLLNSGQWIHLAPVKRLLNPVLRFFQPWTDRKLVLASKTEFDDEGVPHFKGYVLRRVLHRSSR